MAHFCPAVAIYVTAKLSDSHAEAEILTESENRRERQSILFHHSPHQIGGDQCSSKPHAFTLEDVILRIVIVWLHCRDRSVHHFAVVVSDRFVDDRSERRSPCEVQPRDELQAFIHIGRQLLQEACLELHVGIQPQHPVESFVNCLPGESVARVIDERRAADAIAHFPLTLESQKGLQEYSVHHVHTWDGNEYPHQLALLPMLLITRQKCQPKQRLPCQQHHRRREPLLCRLWSRI